MKTRFLRGKCHALYFDCDMNSFQTVILNIYENLLCCAARFHCHLVVQTKITHILSEKFVRGKGSLFHFPLVTFSPNLCCVHFQSDTIFSLLQYNYKLIRSRGLSQNAVSNGCKISLTEEQVIWLGCHAFFVVLKRKQSRYKGVLVELQRVSQGSQYTPARNLLAPIVSSFLHAPVPSAVHPCKMKY